MVWRIRSGFLGWSYITGRLSVSRFWLFGGYLSGDVVARAGWCLSGIEFLCGLVRYDFGFCEFAVGLTVWF